jgi:hypothetical protein
VWAINVTGTITATVSGSGTVADPYKGTANAVGMFTQTAPPGCTLSPNSILSALGAPSVPFNTTAPVSGSAGQLEFHKAEADYFNWDFTGGTFSGTTLSGRFVIDGTPILDNLIIINPLTLTRQ